MFSHRRFVFVSAVVVFALIVAVAESKEKTAAGTWPCWRGPAQNGYANDSHAPLEWSLTKNLKWKTDLPGVGNSSPIVWMDRIFLTSATPDGRERYLLCIDRATGKTLWKETVAKGVPPEKLKHEWSTHANATCVTDGERVYAFYGTPGIFCYDLKGKFIWKRDFGKLDASTGWGIGGSSPVLFENMVIVNGDQGALGNQTDEKGKDYGPSYLWALNKTTGDVIWKTERNQGMSWGTPVFIPTGEGKIEMILNSPHGVWSYDPHTGKELWHIADRGKEELFGEVSPVWGDGRLFVLTGRPGPVYAVRLGGASGDVIKTHLEWRIRRGDRDVSSPLYVNGKVYCVDRKGVATCLDGKTGNKVWSQRLSPGNFSSSLTYVNGKIMVLDDEGTAHIFEPGDEFKLVRRNKLTDGGFFRASPAVVDGQMFIRSDKRLYCLEEGAKAN